MEGTWSDELRAAADVNIIKAKMGPDLNRKHDCGISQCSFGHTAGNRRHYTMNFLFFSQLTSTYCVDLWSSDAGETAWRGGLFTAPNFYQLSVAT